MIKVRDNINILDMLARCGFTTYVLRKEKIFGEATIQKLRKGGLPSWNELDIICRITTYDVGDIIQYVDEKEKNGA